MKKLLITTALLAATASMAAADVTISGTGRFGLVYNEDIDDSGENETLISGRLRFNIDASKETDAGITFGGRIRLQYSIGGTEPTLSPAYLYAEYEGFRFEVGNSNTAFDSAALYYDSEVGFISSSYGTGAGSFYSFTSSPYDATEEERVGVYVSYSIDAFNVQLSYVDPDQTDTVLGAPTEEEISIALAYSTDVFTVSAAAVQDGSGIADNDIYFVGGAYKFGDAQVGLLYTNADNDSTADSGTTTTLFGNYTTGPIKFEAYIANNDLDTNENDLAYGLGVDYDIGGATVSGSIQQGYQEETYADVGVNFSF